MRTVNYRETIHQANFARFGEPRTFEELGHYMIQIINHRSAPNRVLGLAFNLSYRDDVSNTHSSPINGHQNFDSRDELPKGYPGWVGRVWLRMAEPLKSSNPVEWTQTHTGSGGYGGYGGPWQDLSSAWHIGLPLDICPRERLAIYSWVYRIYQDDWPEISRWWDQEQVIRMIRDGGACDQMCEFLWEDPEQYEIDCKIREKVYGTSDLSLR